MDPLSAAASLVGLIAGVGKVASTLNRLKEKYDYSALNITLVSGSLWTVKAALEAIREWRSSSTDTSRPSQQLDLDLKVSLQSCAVLITVVERKLGESDLTRPSVYDKLRFIQLDDVFKDFTASLDSQVRALQLLLTIFQWYGKNSTTYASAQGGEWYSDPALHGRRRARVIASFDRLSQYGA